MVQSSDLCGLLAQAGGDLRTPWMTPAKLPDIAVAGGQLGPPDLCLQYFS